MQGVPWWRSVRDQIAGLIVHRETADMAGKPDPKKPEPQKGAVAKKAAEGEEVPEIEQVLFQGPLFGREANLKAARQTCPVGRWSR